MAPQDQTSEGGPLADANVSEPIIELPDGITIRRYRQSDVTSIARHGK